MNNQYMTDKARSLLNDHEPCMLYGDMGLRENEYDSVTHARFLEFVRSYPVIDISVGHNNYGEFMFVSLRVKRYNDYGHSYYDCLQFWGCGYNDYAGCMQVDWRINVGNYGLVKNNGTITTTKTLQQVKERRGSLGIKSRDRQTHSGNLFETLAELADDDYAYMAVSE